MVETLANGYLQRREAARSEEFNTWLRTQTQPQPGPPTTVQERRAQYEQLVDDLAPVYGVDPTLAKAIMEHESNWNPTAVSKAGAQGLMQLMPPTAKRFGVRDPFDPHDNVRGGLRYLQFLQQRYPGDPAKQAAAYNAGEGAVDRYGGVPPYAETTAYVDRVLGTVQGGQPYQGKLEQKERATTMQQDVLPALPPRGERLETPQGAQERALTGQPPTGGLQEGATVQVAPGRIGPARQTMMPVSEEEAAVFEGSYTPPTAVEVEPGRLEEQRRPLSPILGPALEPGLEEPLWQRVPARIVQGTLEAVSNVLSAAPAFERLVGIETVLGNTAQDVAQDLSRLAQSFEPTGKEENVVDRMAESAGGMLPFFAAGVGAQQGIALLTRAAPQIVRAVGLTPALVGAVVEAGAEAGQVFEALRPLVGDQEAAQRANTTFWRNVWLLTVTNKLGVFGGAEKPFARVMAGAAMEGVQETLQYDIQRRAFWVPASHPQAAVLRAQGWTRQGDRLVVPFALDTATEAAVLGAVMGGGMAGLAGEIGTERAPRPDATSRPGREIPATRVREGYGTDTPKEPMRVYHGSPEAFTDFDPTRGRETQYGRGALWFAEDPEVAGGRLDVITGELEERAGVPQVALTPHEVEARKEALTEELDAARAAWQQGEMSDSAYGEVVARVRQEVADLDQPLTQADFGPMHAGYAQVGTTGQDEPTAGMVRPTYLDIRQPFDTTRPLSTQEAGHLTATLARHPQAAALQSAVERGGVGRVVFERLAEVLGGDRTAARALLQQAGFDGIFHLSGKDGRVWVAFDPAQVIPAYSAQAAPWLATVREILTNERGALGRPRGGLLTSEAGGISLPRFPQKPSPPKPVSLAEGAAGLEPSRFRDAQGRWRIPLKDMPAEELELQDFLRQQGGIKVTDEELQGELKALISRKESGATGLQNNATGRSLQAMAERAQEFGFTATADKTALLEAMDRSLRLGQEVYSVAASGQVPLVEDPVTRQLYEEVTDLLATYQARVETQRRGVQTRAATHAEGAAMLQTGQWTVDDILEIEPGTVLDAATTSALVQGLFRMGTLLQTKAQQFLDSGAGVGAIEEKSFLQGVALFAEADPVRLGVMAELGRGLGILNDPLSGFNRFLNQFQPVLASQGEQSSQQLARRIVALDTPAKVAKTLAKLTQPGLGDMLLEVWINGMLSSPRTHMVNFLSNALTSAWAIPEHLTAATISQTVGSGEIGFGEVQAQLWGLTQGIREGWSLAWQVMRTGEQQPRALAMGSSKVEARYPKALTAQNVLPRFGLDPESVLGHGFDFWAEFIGLGSGGRLPTRGLMAADEFFWSINYRMELAALAYRKARAQGLDDAGRLALMTDVLTNPEAADMRQAANSKALMDTFQRELTPGSLGAQMQTMAEALVTLPGGVELPVGRALLPFVRTPANIARWATERTLLGIGYQEMWADLKAGGARRELATAKVALGTMTMLGVAGLALSKMVTGRGPEDKRLREALLRTGWQPYSLKIGNTYIGYDRLDPLGLLIGMTADVVQIGGDHSLDTTTKLLAAPFFALSRNLTNKTYMQSLAQFFDAMSPHAFTEPDQGVEAIKRYFRSRFASLIPASVATVTQAIDPWDRELWGLFDGMKERTPWTVDGLALKRDRWGMPKLLGWGFGDTWVTRMGRAVTPLTISQDLPSDIDEELVKNHISLGMPGKTFLPNTNALQEWLGDPLMHPRLTPEQYERYVLYSAANVDELRLLGLTYPRQSLQELTAAAGTVAKADPPRAAMPLEDVLNWLVKTPAYTAATPGPMGGKDRMIRTVVSAYEERAKLLMLAREPELRTRFEAAEMLRMLQVVPEAERPARRGGLERLQLDRRKALERLVPTGP